MLKRLLQSLREYKRITILTPIIIIGEVVMECIIPLIIGNLVNNISAGCAKKRER